MIISDIYQGVRTSRDHEVLNLSDNVYICLNGNLCLCVEVSNHVLNVQITCHNFTYLAIDCSCSHVARGTVRVIQYFVL